MKKKPIKRGKKMADPVKPDLSKRVRTPQEIQRTLDRIRNGENPNTIVAEEAQLVAREQLTVDVAALAAEPAPIDDLVIPADRTRLEELIAEQEGRKPIQPAGPIPILERGTPQIPDHWTFDDRARLRAQALDFALRAASHTRATVMKGSEILAEAEQIELWLARVK